jgi:7-cyano-7-deazaguanine reductase
MSKKYGTKAVEDYSNPKNWEIWEAPKNKEVLYQTFPEFTCLCPRSGYPDFATVHIVLIPNKKVLELKCLKLWLNSFRNVGISHENATQIIAKTLYEELGLRYVFVLMEYTPRGNLHTFPMIEIGSGKSEEVKNIKRILLEKVIGRRNEA